MLAAQQVIDAYKLLLQGVPATAGRAYSDRFHPFGEAELPAWRVYAGDEAVRAHDFVGANEHELEVVADGICRATTGMDAQLNALAEAALAAVHASGAAPYSGQLASLQRSVATEGEASMGRVRIRWLCKFFIHPAQPGTFI
ncbi:MAG: hypothetical protein J0M00_20140 [Burkholderiales bacterium]|nr:hypothetical protein [Burkholderiales bacterium]